MGFGVGAAAPGVAPSGLEPGRLQILVARLSDGDPDKEARFKVLTGTRMPAVLVETAFISNAREEGWLADPGFRLRMAGAVVTGIGTPQDAGV